VTRCKFCRIELRDFGETYDQCVGSHACRLRMLDRERRIVRAFFRVESANGSCSLAFETRWEAREFAKATGQPVRRVTVRRKAKP
jgi:hypothetical protein